MTGVNSSPDIISLGKMRGSMDFLQPFLVMGKRLFYLMAQAACLSEKPDR
jgi:hypothetical protein